MNDDVSLTIRSALQYIVRKIEAMLEHKPLEYYPITQEATFFTVWATRLLRFVFTYDRTLTTLNPNAVG